MSKFSIATLVALSGMVSFSASAEEQMGAFTPVQGKPGAGECQFEQDLGKARFDVRSGKLWACGEAGWVFFVSQNSVSCDLWTEEELAAYQPWKKKAYRGGAKVSHDGKLYIARHWTNGVPGKAEAWVRQGVYPGGPAFWSKAEQYHRGSKVVYMGHVYEAASWSKNANPANEVFKRWDKKWNWVGEFSCPE